MTHKQITVTLLESTGSFYSRLNTYRYTVIDEPPATVDGLRVVGMEWDDSGMWQKLVLEDGTRRRAK